MTVLELQGIIAKGGGLDMSARGLSAFDLQGLAAKASGSGAKLILRDTGHLGAFDMMGIAAKSPGNVIFVLD